MADAKTTERPGIQSVEIAFSILTAFIKLGGKAQLKDAAAACNMQVGKVHRYLVSLTRTGLIVQDPATGRYQIGPSAISLGLAGLHLLRVNDVSPPVLAKLRDEIGETVSLAVWSEDGPVIIQIEERLDAFYLNVRIGTRLPMLWSVAGRLFAAFLPPERTKLLISSELRSRRAPTNGEILNRSNYDTVVDQARRQRFARADETFLPGITSVGAPVFNYNGDIRAVVATSASMEGFNDEEGARKTAAVVAAAAEISDLMAAPVSFEI
ncbi:MAG: IclR family transcriptional regulator [Pseudomonadota bacterium]